MQRISSAWAVPLAAVIVHQIPSLPSQTGIGFIAVLGGLCGLRFGRNGLWRFLSLFFLVSAAILLYASLSLDQRMTASLEGTNVRLRGAIVSEIRRFEHGESFRFDIEHCELVDTGRPCALDGRVQLGWYGYHRLRHRLWPGDRLVLNARLKRPIGPLNQGGFDSELWALKEQVVARGYVRKEPAHADDSRRQLRLSNRRESLGIWLARLRMRTESALRGALADPEDAAASVIVGLVTGRQSAIPTRLWDVFNRTGTSHLMSISGLHVTMFAAMVLAIATRVLRWPFPGGTRLLHLLPAQTWAWLFALPAAFAYAAFSGWGVPAQRTCWMLLIAGLVVRLGRADHILSVLALASVPVIAYDPLAIAAPGFWLSFVTVLAIVAVGLPYRFERPLKWRVAVRAQVAATLVLVPLAANFFGAIPVFGAVANAIAIPAISAVITPLGMLGAAFALLWPALAWPFLKIAIWTTEALLAFLVWLDAMPWGVWVTGLGNYASLSLAVLGVMLVLMPSRPAPRLCGLALCLPLLGGSGDRLLAGQWRLQVIDVGQGTAALIQTRSHYLLFDTGPSYGGAGEGAGERLIAPWLRMKQIRKIDRLVISHADRDHSGGAEAIVRQFSVAEVFSSLPPSHSLRQLGTRHYQCARGQAWEWDQVSFKFLHPAISEAVGPRRQKSNASSCVLRIASRFGSALLSADIESPQEADLVRRYGAEGLRSDVLMVPHHGSKTSSSEVFIDAVAPSAAFIQSGYRNRFRHPAKTVVARYEDRGIGLWRTDRHGAIAIEFTTSGAPRIRSWRLESRRYWRFAMPTEKSIARP